MKRHGNRGFALLFVLIIALLALGTYYGISQARATAGNYPLYTDSLTNWVIWKGFTGDSEIDMYRGLLDAARAQNISVAQKVPAPVVYLYENVPGLWYAFSLKIPDDVLTFWSPYSELVITYRCGKDTLTASSNILFFVSSSQKKLYFLDDLVVGREFTVPNPMGLMFDEVPIVYARFNFEKNPDWLLSCAPKRVRSTFRR